LNRRTSSPIRPLRETVFRQQQRVVLVILIFSSFNCPKQSFLSLRPEQVDRTCFPLSPNTIQKILSTIELAQVSTAKPTSLIRSVSTVQSEKKEDSLNRCCVLIDDDEFVNGPNINLSGFVFDVFIKITGSPLDVVEVFRLSPLEPWMTMEPSEEPTEFTDVVLA
jgi:hypothetical protein